MFLPEFIKKPLREAGYRLASARLHPDIAQVPYNNDNSDIRSGGEAFLIRLASTGWKTCVDIGANDGDWTAEVLSASPNCKVTCFEPIPVLAERLMTRFKEHSSRCEIIQSAVGSTGGEIDLYVGEIAAHASFHRHDGGRVPIKVPVVDLDSYADDHQIEFIDCCKIDTEGHELSVLQGADLLINEKRIGIITFEYGEYSRSAGVSFKMLYDRLTPQYSICHIIPGGIIPAPYDPTIERFGFSNWAAFLRDIYP